MQTKIRLQYSISDNFPLCPLLGPKSCVWGGHILTLPVNPPIRPDHFGQKMKTKNAFDLLFSPNNPKFNPLHACKTTWPQHLWFFCSLYARREHYPVISWHDSAFSQKFSSIWQIAYARALWLLAELEILIEETCYSGEGVVQKWRHLLKNWRNAS